MRVVLCAAALLAAAGGVSVGKPRDVGDTSSLVHLRTELSSRVGNRQAVGESVMASSTWALMSMNSSKVSYGALLNVTIQRVSNESATERQMDFVGLYWAEDAFVDQPWNWVETNNKVDRQTVTMEANKGGDMEVRLVRPPNKILARLPLKVFSPCNPLCYKHGVCIEGACNCNLGYAFGSREMPCMSPSGDILSITAEDHKGTQNFQQGMGFKVMINTSIAIEYNGADYIGVYPNGSKNGSMAVAWKTVAKNSTQFTAPGAASGWSGGRYETDIDFPAVKSPGLYVFRFTRKNDMEVLYESPPFTVYEFCPRDCTNHGSCVAGVCVCTGSNYGGDCSLGPNMVKLTPSATLMFKNEDISINFDREFDEKFPFLQSDSDWIGMYSPNDTDVSRPFAYLYAQGEATSEGENSTLRRTGSVNFTVPVHGDQYVFKYIRNDHTVMAETEPIDVYIPCDPLDCSGHGECVGHGLCNCTDGWRGSGCEIGDVAGHLLFNDDNVLVGQNLTVTFTRGLNSAHDEDYIGLFQLNDTTPNPTAAMHAHRQAFLAQAKDMDAVLDGNETGADDESVEHMSGMLYAYANANATKRGTGGKKNAEEGDVDLVTPLTGTFVLRYVDVVNQKAKGESAPFSIYPACPLDCSGYGTCYQGVCMCDNQHMLPDCRRFKGEVTLSKSGGNTNPVLLPDELLDNVTVTVEYTRPPGWFKPGDFVGLMPVAKAGNEEAITARSVLQLQYAVAGANEEAEGITGAKASFVLSSLMMPGMYKFWYVDGSSFEMLAETPAFEIKPQCGTGNFDLAEDKCTCPESKQGPACEADTCCYSLVPDKTDTRPEDEVVVKWGRPNKAGRNQDFIGLYFANETAEFGRPYAFAFADGSDSEDGNSGSVTLKMPPAEEAYKVHYISSASFESMDASSDMQVTIPCDPVDCSGHGACLQGSCKCSGQWGGVACNKETTLVPELNIDLDDELTEGSAFTVGWGRPEGVGNRGDFVGIYMEGDPYNQPRGYNFVPVGPETFTGTIQMVAPNTPGEYQLRWISSRDHSVLVATPDFSVTGVQAAEAGSFNKALAARANRAHSTTMTQKPNLSKEPALEPMEAPKNMEALAKEATAQVDVIKAIEADKVDTEKLKAPADELPVKEPGAYDPDAAALTPTSGEQAQDLIQEQAGTAKHHRALG